MYADAINGNKGDSAALVSPSFNSGTGRSLQFWYHLFSSDPVSYKPGVLKVSVSNTSLKEICFRW